MIFEIEIFMIFEIATGMVNLFQTWYVYSSVIQEPAHQIYKLYLFYCTFEIITKAKKNFVHIFKYYFLCWQLLSQRGCGHIAPCKHNVIYYE